MPTLDDLDPASREKIAQIVADAPPLTDAQRQRLQQLFRTPSEATP